MPFTLQVDDKELEQKIQELIDQAGTMKPVFQTIGRKVGNRIRLGFRSGTSPTGERWKPLRFRNGQPLRDTGVLQASITSSATDDYVDIGTNTKYGFVHQFGLKITAKPGQPGQNSIGPRKGAKRMVFPGPFGLVFAKSVTIPARPFLPLNQSGQIDLPEKMQQDVLTAIRKHFEV